jgi:D-sedoheptulose 7-phosphate isomerase
MISLIKQNFIEARDLLDKFISDEQNWIAFEKAGNALVNAISNQKKILSCGNGGSLCDAMHFAEELTGRFRNERNSVAAMAITDPGHLTCAGNDYGFESIFSRFIDGMGQEGDVLVAISTSGNSKNIIRAIESAKNKKMMVIALTGKDGGKIASICDIELRVPHMGFSDRIQEIHIKLIHSLIHFIELKLFTN